MRLQKLCWSVFHHRDKTFAPIFPPRRHTHFRPANVFNLKGSFCFFLSGPFFSRLLKRCEWRGRPEGDNHRFIPPGNFGALKHTRGQIHVAFWFGFFFFVPSLFITTLLVLPDEETKRLKQFYSLSYTEDFVSFLFFMNVISKIPPPPIIMPTVLVWVVIITGFCVWHYCNYLRDFVDFSCLSSTNRDIWSQTALIWRKAVSFVMEVLSTLLFSAATFGRF